MEAHELDELVENGASVSDKEVQQLYTIIPGVWVLLKPIEWNENKGATRLIILKYHKDKEVIREEVSENDDWLGLGSLIYFFTGYDGTCKI